MAKPAPSKSSLQTSAAAVGGRPPGLFTWVAIGLVIVVVLVLVIVKVTKPAATATNSGAYVPTDATTMTYLTTIPAATFNSVGVASSAFQVTPPLLVKNQPPLTGLSSTGKKVPQVLYIGAEYCPYCAAQRWSTIIALSRFGTWKGLGDTTSSSIDVYPSTPTFTFRKATYSSPYVAFEGVEQFTNVSDPANQFYYPLQNPTKQESAVMAKYDVAKYFGSGVGAGSIPFLSIGNKFFTAGASFSPSAFHSLSRTQIASNLSSPSSPISQAVIASADYQTAAICNLTNQMPANVCTSPGVVAAKKALKI